MKLRKKQEKLVTANIKGNVPVLFLKENEMFVAYSPALELSTCGKTFEEAQKNFEEALLIFFEECIKDNTLKEILPSPGWKEKKNGFHRLFWDR